jgi:hypothetical protein
MKFDDYILTMITDVNPSNQSSIYNFWKTRINLTIEPFQSSSRNQDFMLVKDKLLELCIAFLFGDGKSIPYCEDLDMVATCLVMVKPSQAGATWDATMAEPIVLYAGLNYLAQHDHQRFMNYFANQLFSPLSAPNPDASARGHIIEFLIALRFRQGWWKEEKLKNHLPDWVNSLDIPEPIGVLDCRNKEPRLKKFVEQLQNLDFPYIVLPSVFSGPDLRYSIFSANIKSTWTLKSKTTIYVAPKEGRKNNLMMNPKNWYISQPDIHSQCQDAISSLNSRFLHLQFELPDTAAILKEDFVSGARGKDHVICVNLESDFARDFFGENFITQYKDYVKNLLPTKKPVKNPVAPAKKRKIKHDK